MKSVQKLPSLMLVTVFLAAVLFAVPQRTSAQEQSTARKFAFLVGVEKYEHGKLPNLEFAENDVEDLDAVLKADEYKTVLMTTKVGKTDRRLLPTQANVWKALTTFLNEYKPTKDDLIIVGLAGHGIQPFGSDDSYFCPVDANPTIKEIKTPQGTKNVPASPETLVSVAEMLKTLDDSGVGYKLLLVDACRNDPSVRGSRRGVADVSRAALPDQTGVLLSCKAGEFSFEHKSLGRGHGAFFHHVIEGFKGAAADRKGQITWDGLGLYVRSEVPAKVHELFGEQGGDQSPNAIGNLSGTPAVLARITPAFHTSPTLTPKKTDGPPLLPAPFNQQEAVAARSAWARYEKVEEEQTNSLGMKLTLIPAGEFQMGSAETPEELAKAFPHVAKTAVANERPQHRVRITRPFYLGVYEVTKAQFRKYVEATNYKTDAEQDGKGATGYTGQKDRPFEQRRSFNWRDWGANDSDDAPVVNVSWNDAVAFCGWLSLKEGKKYRLPTEAEWEYACRAGTTTRAYNGNDADLTLIGNIADKSAKEKFAKWTTVDANDGWPFTSPVGQFRPNAFGLYDMIGNAREWCQDRSLTTYYTLSPIDNPPGPVTGFRRIVRGASWMTVPGMARSSARSFQKPHQRYMDCGFRIACEVTSEPEEPPEAAQIAYIGFITQATNPATAQVLGVPSGSGVVVSHVYPGSPGDRGGLKLFDTILEIAGHKITRRQDVPETLKLIGAGSVCEMAILRQGKEMKITVTTERRPAEMVPPVGIDEEEVQRDSDGAQRWTDDDLGLAVRELTSLDIARNKLRDVQGVVVEAVKPNSISSRAGLRRGMIIHHVQMQPVHSPDQIQAALGNVKLPCLLGVYVEYGSGIVVLRPDAAASASEDPSKRTAGKSPALLVAPFSEPEVRAARTAWAGYLQVEQQQTNSLEMKLALIPPGEFRMGAPESDQAAKVSEKPLHRVRITKPFFIGLYEVTKGQFAKFVEATDYKTDAEKDGKGGTGYAGIKNSELQHRPSFNWRDWGVDQNDGSPVVNVSWNDATAFCDWLSRKEGKKYRLPTDAEWEYACRAGTTTLFYNGDDPELLTRIANFADKSLLDMFPGWRKKPGFKSVESSDGNAMTGPAGQHQANNFGLYDMLGNAWEWCGGPSWGYTEYLVWDPEAAPRGSQRILRGGSWAEAYFNCRSSCRVFQGATFRNFDLGFRVALVPSDK
jgi:formylglycine-generating enzyme required for sulfatase activity